MLAITLHLLATLAVLSPLVRQESWAWAAAPLVIIALVWWVSAGFHRLPRWVMVGGPALVAGIGMLVAILASGGRPGVGLMVAGVSALMVGSCGFSRERLLIMVALLPVLSAVLWHALGMQQALVPLAWILTAWPLVVHADRGRVWHLAVLTAAMAGIFLVVVQVPSESIGILGWCLVKPWSALQPVITLAQVLLVGLVIAPVLWKSWRGWRWVVVSGFCFTALAWLAVWSTGPWPSGWPPAAVLAISTGALTVVTGLTGMLFATRDRAALAAATREALAFGLAATAVRLLAPAHDLAAAAAPLILAWAIAALLGIGLIISRCRFGPMPAEKTRLVVSERRTAVRTVVTSFRTIRHLVSRSMLTLRPARMEVRHLTALAMLLATTPIWRILGASMLLPCLAFLAMLLARNLNRVGIAWIVVQAGMCGASALALGLGGPAAVLAMTVSVAGLWPFVRWSRMDPGLALPLVLPGLAVMALIGSSRSLDPRHLFAACALAALAVNLVGGGRLRTAVLGLAATCLVVEVVISVFGNDPFTARTWCESILLPVIPAALWTTPFLLLILCWSGETLIGSGTVAHRRLAKVRVLLAVAVLVALASGFRPGPLIGLPAWVLALVMAGRTHGHTTCLDTVKRAGDLTAWILATVPVVAVDISRILTERGAIQLDSSMPRLAAAGSLQAPAVAASTDLLAAALTALLLVAVRRGLVAWAGHGLAQVWTRIRSRNRPAPV